MAREKELPKHIKEFYDRDDKVRKLLDTTHAVHSEAYQKGLDVLRDEQGRIDYQKLEEVKVQDQFLDKLMDHYLTAAVRDLGLKEKPIDTFEQDVILQKYIGVTRGELQRIIRKNKGDYTLEAHEGLRDKLIKKQTQELMPLRHGHLEEGHIEDILKHTGVDKYIAKDRIQTGHAATILDIYKQKGEVTLSDLNGIVKTPEEKGGWGSDVYLTEEAKEEIKELKKKHKKSA